MAWRSEVPRGGLAGEAGSVLVGRAVVSALSWGGTVLIARALDVHDFGVYSFVFALLGLMQVVTEPGVGRLVLGLMADESKDREGVLGAYVVLRWWLGFLGLTLAVLVVLVGGYPRETVLATALGGLVVVLATPSRSLDVYFQAQHRMHVVAKVDVFAQVLQLVAVVLGALIAPGILVFTAPHVLREVAALWSKRRLVHAEMRPRYAADTQMWKAMLTEAIPLTIGGALATAYYRIDMMLLSQMDSFASVAQYSIAYKFGDLLLVAGTAGLAPLAAALVRAQNGTQVRRFIRLVRAALEITTLLGAVGVALFALCARDLITLFYSARYVEDGGASAVMLLASAVIQLQTLVGLHVLVARGKHKLYPWTGLTGLILNIGLNIILIPRWSYVGAAAATLVTEVVVLVLMWILVHRTRADDAHGHLPRIALAAALAAGGVVYVMGLGLGRFMPLWAGATLLGAVIAIVGSGVVMRQRRRGKVGRQAEEPAAHPQVEEG